MADPAAWLHEVVSQTPTFLSTLASPSKPGYFRYSLSGDLFPETIHWGLGNTVFAVKSYATLGQLTELPEQQRVACQRFTESFAHPSGEIFDPLVARRAFVVDKLSALRRGYFKNFWHRQTRQAETRQAYVALRLLGAEPKWSLDALPTTPAAVSTYVAQLPWSRPWSAGSHFSHLLFFIHNTHAPNTHALIAAARDTVQVFQHTEDGAWYTGRPSLQEKINGAMKVLTGFAAARIAETPYAERLVDLCLSAQHDAHACDNFNVVYVLRQAAHNCPGYRQSEIATFAEQRLTRYRTYWHSDPGGFSFYPSRANTHYYGARITSGKNEPDVHGTSLFLWGISIIVQLIGRQAYFPLTEQPV